MYGAQHQQLTHRDILKHFLHWNGTGQRNGGESVSSMQQTNSYYVIQRCLIRTFNRLKLTFIAVAIPARDGSSPCHSPFGKFHIGRLDAKWVESTISSFFSHTYSLTLTSPSAHQQLSSTFFGSSQTVFFFVTNSPCLFGRYQKWILMSLLSHHSYQLLFRIKPYD